MKNRHELKRVKELNNAHRDRKEERPMRLLETPPNSFISQWAMGSHLLVMKGPAIKGPAHVVYDKRMYQGGRLLSFHTHNPTYEELWSIADTLINDSGDLHHIFIEDFAYNPKEDWWELITGS